MLFYKILLIVSVFCAVAWYFGITPSSLREQRTRRKIRRDVGRMNLAEIAKKLKHDCKRGSFNVKTARAAIAQAERILVEFGLENDKEAKASLALAHVWAKRIVFSNAHAQREKVDQERAMARRLTMPPPPPERAIPVDAHGHHVNMDLDAPFEVGVHTSLRRAG